MMETRVFDVNPETGTTKLWHYDQDTEEATIETIEDATALLEENQFLANEAVPIGKGEFVKVASIPLALFFELQRKFGNDQKEWRKWLNDRDNRLFRTRLGRV